MNERLKQLKEQAEFVGDRYALHDEFAEKFARLIIQDCMDVVDGYTKGRTFDTHYDAVEQIKNLFGVE